MFNKSCVVLVAVTISACGGGGGDPSDSDTPAPDYWNGSFSGSLEKTIDNCLIGTAYSGAPHVLRVDGPEVVVTINTLTMRGRPHGQGALEAKNETASDKVTTTVIARYGWPAGTELGAAFNTTVTVLGKDNASGFTCNLTYAGTVRRM